MWLMDRPPRYVNAVADALQSERYPADGSSMVQPGAVSWSKWSSPHGSDDAEHEQSGPVATAGAGRGVVPRRRHHGL